MLATSHSFKRNAHEALHDRVLQRALLNLKSGFQDRRAGTIAKLPEWEDLRERGRDIKNHTLAHLDFYLEAYAAKVEALGGKVHWARTGAEMRETVLEICRAVGARTVSKGKSMIAEEVALNDA